MDVQLAATKVVEDLPALIDRLGLGVEVRAGFVGAGFLDVPATTFIGYDMPRLRVICHRTMVPTAASGCGLNHKNFRIIHR